MIKASAKPLVCYVRYGFYGCDTGCDGHWVVLALKSDPDHAVRNTFNFAFAEEGRKDEFARELCAEWVTAGAEFAPERCEVRDWTEAN